MSTTSSFKVRLRAKPTPVSVAPPASVAASRPIASVTSSLSAKTTESIISSSSTSSTTSHTQARVSKLSGKPKTGLLATEELSTLPRIEITRNERLQNLLKTPPLPTCMTTTSTFDKTKPTEELTGANSTANISTTRQFNTMSSTQHSLIIKERFEVERICKMIESEPLLQKFSKPSLHRQPIVEESSSCSSSDHEDGENELPKTATVQTAPACIASPEPVPSARSQRKIVRAYDANESVVEVLPDHVGGYGEPSFVRRINNGVLRLPNSHQKIPSGKSYSNEVAAAISSQASSSSTSKRRNPVSASKKRLPVSASKRNASNSQRVNSQLKEFPPKETAPKSSRVLRPLNLDSHMASVATLTPLAAAAVSTTPTDASGDSKTSEQTIDMDISSMDEGTARLSVGGGLKSARSMPDLEEPKDGGRITLPRPEPSRRNAKTSENPSEAGVMAPPPVPVPALKSLKMIGSVPKLPSTGEKRRPPASSSSSSSSGVTPLVKIPLGPSLVAGKSTPSKPTTVPPSETARDTVTIKGRSYQVLNTIGRGGSAVVFQVFDLTSKRTFALKKVDLSKADEAVQRGFCDEIKLLNSLRDCKRVVRLIDYEYRSVTSSTDGRSKKVLFIVMEKGDDDLATVIRSFQKEGGAARLSPHLIRFYWQEMVKVVAEIHARNVVHSDLKPVNFIIVSGKLKLIDFGIANKIQSNKTSVYKETIIGTVDFMAPEVFQKKHKLEDGKSVTKFNQKADIWAMGVILYTLVYGASPWAEYRDNMQKGLAIINDSIEYPPNNDPLLLDVIKQCLQKDPRKRPSADELLAHSYLTGDAQATPSRALSRASSNESLNGASGKGATWVATAPSSQESKISNDLRSKMENLTPNTLRTISKMVEESLSKKPAP